MVILREEIYHNHNDRDNPEEKRRVKVSVEGGRPGF